MAHKKAGGSTSLGRDSQAQRLGVKRFGGQIVSVGDIIIRQRGSKFGAGHGVLRGTDDTLFAAVAGVVKFSKKQVKKFTGNLENARIVSIIPNPKA